MITTQNTQNILDNTLEGTEKDFLKDLFSTINHSFFQYNSISYNHTSASPTTSWQHLTKGEPGKFDLF